VTTPPDVSSPVAIFERRGSLYQPTTAAVGPWDPGALHGGPVAMLIARELESCPADGALELVRLTVELLRPVPTTPLGVRARVERPGRRVQVLGAVVTAGDTEVAWARALRVRRSDLQVESDAAPPPPGPEGLAPWSSGGFGTGYGMQGVELRVAGGAIDEPGPATVWVRLKLPVLPGEAPTPFHRAAAAADFGNGFSWVLDWSSHVFVNPDLTINLVREPEGDWVAVESATAVGPGHGLADSALYDVRGAIGRSLQSLYIAPR
jgi:hypothetical protein